ncbi:MAG: Hpt domain-containing protein, partial [Oceanobacter sp.]
MMTPLLKQFISESREQLQSISEALLGLEKGQDPTESLNELFGMVHTLKGSSGLFDFPEMTHVLHAGEDVLTEIREKPDLFTQELGDLLFEVLDFVSQQMDELEENDGQLSSRKELANDLESRLRACHPDNQAADNQTVSAESNEVESAATAAPRNESDNEPETDLGSEANDDAKQPDDTTSVPACSDLDSVSDPETVPFPLSKIPEDVRQQAVDELLSGNSITLLCYTPDEQCFFAGEDPFLQIRHTPGLLWGQINTRDELAGIDTLDPFQCLLEFWCVSQAETSDLEDYFRVQPEAVQFYTLLAQDLILPASSHEAIHYSHETLREFYRHYASRDVGSLISDLQSELEHQEEQGLRITDNDLSWLLRIANRQPDHPLMEFLWKRLCESARFDPMEEAELTDRADSAITNLKPSQPVCREQMTTLLETQRHILSLPNEEAWSGGRIQAAGNALSNMMESTGQTELQQQARSHITETLNNGDNQAITDWLDGLISGELWPDHASQEESVAPAQAQSP